MVHRTLEALDIGAIHGITFKPATNKKNEKGNSIAIHFTRWFRNNTADKLRLKLISGNSADINYTAKSYWKVVAFQQKTKIQEELPKFVKPTITFDDDEEQFGPKLGAQCALGNQGSPKTPPSRNYEEQFGPKLGAQCAEKYNMPKVKREPIREREREREPIREREPRQSRQSGQFRENTQKLRQDARPRQAKYEPREPNHPPPGYTATTVDTNIATMVNTNTATTADLEPGQEPGQEVNTHGRLLTTYHEYQISPDAFDFNSNSYHGVILPKKKKVEVKKSEPVKKKLNIIVDDSEDEDEDEDDEEVDLLYGDL